ncbi:MFS transporter [Pseudonocardia kujensis]|uniref:MFS transporter n=1 Tax=Pseudonocardia kujensis TaxID=1128675 RepID=UPI001E4AAECF|nr:MFS transporter [Pseudonocardia kujensis]MCE0765056.1 MFS transporter [Pseudonocardia kujensis]
MTNPAGLAAAVPDIEDRIYRKMRRRLIPIVMLGLFISNVDRINIGVLAGPMSLDLGLTAAAFGLAAGLFAVGYSLFEIPSNMALAKFGARRWIARIMVSWGAVTMLLGTVQNELSLHILRALLGVAEAGFVPGVLLYMAIWCPPRMLPKTYSMMNLAVPVALALGSVLTSTLLGLHGLLGLAGWRWAFLLEGIPAVLLGVYIWFRFPNTPADAGWLDADEKAYLAEAGVQTDNTRAHRFEQLGAVLRRPAAWMFTLTYFCMGLGYWTTIYFLPTIVREQFGLDAAAAGFVSAIPWAFSVLVMLAVMRSVTRTGDRTWHLTILQLVGAVGVFVAASTGTPVLALIGLSLGGASFFGTLSTWQSMQAQVFAGDQAAVALGMITGFTSLSGLLGPSVMGVIKDATGSTHTGLLIMSGFFVAAAVLMFFVSRWTDRVTGGLAARVPVPA